MKPIVQQFYQTLYTAEEVPLTNIDDYLTNISFTRQASPKAILRLTDPITMEDLRDQIARSPRQNNPGEHPCEIVAEERGSQRSQKLAPYITDQL
ncbi:hypothetical protein BD560DRAFT_440903 [Blakeslea trispora]|nr:hypothetical protein BD560DRAFT_440903 [Blakeslea trispora]